MYVHHNAVTPLLSAPSKYQVYTLSAFLTLGFLEYICEDKPEDILDMKERGLGFSALVPGCGVYKPCVGCQRGISSLFCPPRLLLLKMQRLSLFFVAVAGLQGEPIKFLGLYIFIIDHQEHSDKALFMFPASMPRL